MQFTPQSFMQTPVQKLLLIATSIALPACTEAASMESTIGKYFDLARDSPEKAIAYNCLTDAKTVQLHSGFTQGLELVSVGSPVEKDPQAFVFPLIVEKEGAQSAAYAIAWESDAFFAHQLAFNASFNNVIKQAQDAIDDARELQGKRPDESPAKLFATPKREDLSLKEFCVAALTWDNPMEH